MRPYKFLVIFAIFLSFVCASCTDETASSLAGGTPVVFISSMKDGSSLVPPTSGEAYSRATNNTWHGMDSIGIYMYPATGSVTNAAATNKLYYVPGTTTNANLLPDSDDEIIYYPTDGSAVRFTAYYPYQANVVSNSNMYTIRLNDQSTLYKHSRADLLLYRGTTDYTSSSPSAKLTFEHRFVKLTICVVPSASLASGTNFSGATATLSGFVDSGVISLSTDAFSGLAVSGNPITPYCKSISSEEAVFEAIILPSGLTGRKINITVDGQTYTYNLPSDLSFTKGQHYTCNFTLTDTGIILTNNTVTNWTGGIIGWNDSGNYLSAPAEVKHYRNASTNNSIVISTNSTSKPTIEYSTSYRTVSGSLTVESYLTEKSLLQTNAPNPNEWTLTYDLAENLISTGSDRIAYIFVTVDDMEVIVQLTQSLEAPPTIMGGDANCYLLPPGGRELLIPIARAKTYSDTYDSSHPVITSGETFYADVEWSEYSSNRGTGNGTAAVMHSSSVIQKVEAVGTGPNGFIKVTSGSTPGNAVVTLKKRVSGVYKILWSWHIWVTDYDPNVQNKYFTNSDGVTSIFMDRNLGAESANQADGAATYGLLYQWGRKDPLPGTRNSLFLTEEPYVFRCANSAVSSICNVYIRIQTYGSHLAYSTISNGSQVSVTTSLGNPFMLYKRETSPYDWSTISVSSGSGLRWDLAKSAKAIDDPCPVGWHVPASGVWNGLDMSNFTWSGTSLLSGNTHSTMGFYPAAGMRGNSGSPYFIGDMSWYWYSSSINSDSASDMQLSTTSVGPTGHASNMSSGQSVRCVQSTD